MLLIAVITGLLAVTLVTAARLHQQRFARPPGRHVALVPVSVRQDGDRVPPRHVA